MITLQFSTQDDFVSRVIRDDTRSPFSHVDIVLRSGELLGARSDGGVEIRHPGYAPFSAVHQISLPTSLEQEGAFYTFSAAQVGKPYDTMAVLGLGIDRNWRTADKWFCSELVAAALEAAGIIAPLSSPVNWISPRDVLLIAEAMQVARAA